MLACIPLSFLRYGTPLLTVEPWASHFWDTGHHSCSFWMTLSIFVETDLLHPSAVAAAPERDLQWQHPEYHLCQASWFSAVGPTGRAKKCVDVKSAPYAKHTASRTS
jgi:hypothetical protein